MLAMSSCTKLFRTDAKVAGSKEDYVKLSRPGCLALIIIMPLISLVHGSFGLFAKNAAPESESKEDSQRTLVVGIAGGTGSGKTTLAEAIVSKLGAEEVLHLSHDSYYKDLSNLSIEERDKQNFDHPDALDTALLVKQLKQLRNGQTVIVPSYNFSSHSRNRQGIETRHAPVIIVEGILLFHEPELRKLLDLKIFVDTESDTRFIRRLKRDVAERGRDMESVLRQYESTVRPMHKQFVEPCKQYADLVLLEGVNAAALETVVSRLRSQIAESTASSTV